MHRALRLSGFLLLALAAACPAQSAPAADPPSLAHARALLSEGKPQEAQHELEALAALHPEPSGVERLRGILAYQNGQLTAADAAFSRAVAEDPNDLESRQMQGVILYREGKPAEAIPLLEKAHMAGTVANADPKYVLALCYIATGRYDDARRTFATQYDFGPDSAAAWLVTARMLFRQEQTAQAAQAAEHALELDPHLPLAHRLLGEIDLATGNIAGALTELEKERSLNPLDGETYDRLGDAYLRKGDAARAQQVLDRAVLLEPNATGPYILLGRAMLEQHDPATAAMYLERAAKMDPANPLTHMLLGRALVASGRRADADREFQTVQRLQSAKTSAPSNP